MERHVILVLCWLFGLFAANSVGVGGTTMAQEETVVRRTYAKTAYAVQLNTVYELVRTAHRSSAAPPNTSDIAREVKAKELHFALRDFKVGDVSDILQINYGDLVTKPNGGDAIRVTPVMQSVREEDETVTTQTATAEWTTEQILQGEDWNIPAAVAVAKLEKEMPGTYFTRYCSFTVTAEFLGRRRTYRALFLFGQTNNGRLQVFPIDTVVNINGGAIEYFGTHPVYPHIFLETRMKELPAVRDWFGTAASALCPSGEEDACCNLDAPECATGGER